MNCKVEHTSPTQIAIAVRLPYAELELLLRPAAEKISAEVEIEGFRKGNAPYEVVKQKVGEFKILEEAARMYIAKNFTGILEDVEDKEYRAKGVSFEPVGEPQVAITKLAAGEELKYKITLSLLPAIELPDYKAIAAEVLKTKCVPETTEKEITDTIEWLRESRVKLVTVNRGAGIGDRVEIDFEAKMGGVALEGGSSKNHPFILGKGRFPPGFEDQLAGMKAGEEKTFTIAVPQDWRDKGVAGKALEFKTKMNLVQERKVPEWGDDFAKSIGNFESAAAAEKNICEGLGAEKEVKERERLRMAMADAIAAQTKAEIPSILLERELEKMVAELKSSIDGMGLKFADYLAHIRKTEENLKAGWRPDAERRLKIALILRAIAWKEGIRPSDDEIQAAAKRGAAHRGMTEEDSKGIDREAFSDYHKGIARNEKVLQFLEKI